MKRVVIEKAKLKDIPDVEDVYKKGFIDEARTQYPTMTTKEILSMLKDPKKRIQDFKKGTHGKDRLLLVAKDGDKVIGFGEANLKRLDKSSGFLNKLYILKKYRRKGIGKKLTKERIAWLKKKRAKKIESYVLVKNNPSIKNLEKQGFEKYCFIMRKLLK